MAFSVLTIIAALIVAIPYFVPLALLVTLMFRLAAATTEAQTDAEAVQETLQALFDLQRMQGTEFTNDDLDSMLDMGESDKSAVQSGSMIPLSLWVIAAALVPAANSLPQNNQTNFLLIMFYFVLLVANLIPIERDNVNIVVKNAIIEFKRQRAKRVLAIRDQLLLSNLVLDKSFAVAPKLIDARINVGKRLQSPLTDTSYVVGSEKCLKAK